MSKIKTHYDNLGVMRTAQPEVIKAAYKALAQKYHPDRNPDNPDAERIMKIINTAYQVLIDPVRRAEHDKWIDEQERRAGQSHQSTNQSSNAYQNTANGSSSASHSNEHASQNTHHQTNGYQRYYEYANGNQNKHSHQNDDKHNSNNQQKHYYKNDDIQDEHGENKGSQLGLFFMPVIMTSLLSKLLFSVGIIFGFIATLLTFGVCSGCYSYTYDKVQSSKFIKEFFAILSGIFGCILWVIFLFFIADIFDYKQSSNDVQPNTTSQSTLSYQNAQNVNISSNDIKAPNTNSEPSLNPQLVLAEAKKRYDNAVANINAVWSSLPPSTQEFLRAEQRAINKNREADCTAYGNAQSTDRDLAKAYRYLCEVPQLNERAEYLKTQLNTVVTPPTPMIEPQPLPETGATNKPNLHGNSPLQIKTNAGSHYWVKIVNSYNEKDELASFFIRGGETLDVNLPMGSYVVKYAYGDTWYGRDYLFGEDTGYSKADEVLEFYHGQGYVIELIQQLNGNLHTTAIDESQF